LSTQRCAFPAALAIRRCGWISGKDLLAAIHVGVEVECKIAEAISPRHYQDGFHPRERVESLAAPPHRQAQGTRRRHNDPRARICRQPSAGCGKTSAAMMKPFQAGHASESGMSPSILPALGWTGAERSWKRKRGFFHAYGGGYEIRVGIVDHLGKPWTFQNPGVSIKPSPSGSLTHPGMTELLRLVRLNSIHSTDVDRVEVGHHRNMPTADSPHPTTHFRPVSAWEFCMAIILVDGTADLTKFTDAVVTRNRCAGHINRVRFYRSRGGKRSYDR